jgi:hypothetical protein
MKGVHVLDLWHQMVGLFDMMPNNAGDTLACKLGTPECEDSLYVC